VIFVDSNIPMYLIGAPHPHKVDAQRLLENCTAADERLVTNAEVLQEILHRYVAIDRREWIQLAFDAILGVVDEVLPIREREVARAKEIALARRNVSARDAVHVAVMWEHGIETILSFDHGFDGLPRIKRLGP
jgi:predicted nucleic acid-binding protein